jgi:Lon protease-like protein
MLMAGSLWSQETDPARQIADQWQAEQALRAERGQRLNELMSTMAKEMDAIHEARDSSQRQQLMAKHRVHMHEAMDLMRDLGGTHMREVTAQHIGPHHGSMHGSAGGHQKMMSSIPRKDISDASRLADIETRVDMMQIMLESMLAEQADR